MTGSMFYNHKNIKFNLNNYCRKKSRNKKRAKLVIFL